MPSVRKSWCRTSTRVLLAVSVFWSTGLIAASGLPAGTFVLDVANKTQSFGDVSETVKEVRKNRCQLDQTPPLTIMGYLADGGEEVSRGDQKQALGIKSQGQDCGFAGSGQAWTFAPGAVIPTAAEIGGWVIDFIVTDDAVFEIALLDDSGSPLQLLDASGAGLMSAGAPVEAFKVYTGRAACSGGAPISLEDWEQAVFPCVAQSNPNSDFDGRAGFRPGTSLNTFGSDLSLPEQARQIKISVVEGNTGVTAAEFDFELIPTGSLTCETDGSPGSGEVVTITPPDEFISIGDGAQCRRLPNRNGAACDAVPYILNASCDSSDQNCEFDFQHGTQSGVPREDHAFVCEVWWPSREPNFETNGVGSEPIVDRTQVFWGGLTTPLTQGDDLNYCRGVTPLFSGSTFSGFGCGSGLVYELSDNTGPVDGGTVSDSGGSCSLLQAYDDVLLLPKSDPDAPADQCTAATCPGGSGVRQLACLLQERIVLEEDPAPFGTSGVQTGAGRIDEAATPTVRKHEVILIEGDIKFRGL